MTPEQHQRTCAVERAKASIAVTAALDPAINSETELIGRTCRLLRSPGIDRAARVELTVAALRSWVVHRAPVVPARAELTFGGVASHRHITRAEFTIRPLHPGRLLMRDRGDLG